MAHRPKSADFSPSCLGVFVVKSSPLRCTGLTAPTCRDTVFFLKNIVIALFFMTTYSAVRDHNQETLRQAIIAAATRLLQRHGGEAITVRRVAQEIGCSTTVIYSLFGSKDSLANALFQEGCRLLNATMASVSLDSEPRQVLARLADAYWQFSQQHPHYYTMMFSGTLAEFKPNDESKQEMENAIDMLIALLDRYRQQGLVAAGESFVQAKMLWAALHGVIQLALAGHLHTEQIARAIYAQMVSTMVAAIVLP
ncbi:TetR/AcrR family transcriptional regulator [Chloroflexia bacterium SDU3-3]|nr:TetR/AcrR family transcriptional regulator [Chloroflexia bacterium SDU3-3]